ncbi:hypothetical protein [Citrobacter koseri]|uniref:hypothetical protein n=1 Tax=Citrobacter koseri TaxID=545 RepID=UPI00388F12EE
MSNKIITLSGAATDVLYALFYRGALLSGDLPSKSGTAELREMGFAETRHTATQYQKENYFTFLTAEGQEFAIKHLAETRFGKPVDKQYRSTINISVELDTSDAQKALDDLADKIRNSEAFKDLKYGWSLEKNGTMIINHGQAFILDGMIQDSGTTYEMNLKNAVQNAAHINEAIQTSDTVYFIRDCEYIAGNGKNYRFGFAAKIRMGVVLSYLVRHEVPGAKEPLETEFQLHDSEHAFNYFNSLYSMLCR